MSGAARAARLARVRAAMVDAGTHAMLLSLGADLPWLTGYEAMPLERLTMLVLPADAEPTLVVPRLEAPRVVEHPDLFVLRPWEETEDPVEVVASLVVRGRRSGDGLSLAISDRAWATFLLQLQRVLPAARWSAASAITSPLRAVKDETEVAALAAASAAADRVAADLIAGRIALVGRTEADVSAEIGRRLVEEGHHRVNFAIVGSGPNAASPHHDAGLRPIEPKESVVCDFGGTMAGYCSDITRTVFTGPPPAEFVELYRVLQAAQAAAVASATIGTPCEEVDAAARRIIEDAGYGPQFFHRTGHGIGREEHEDPYIVSGNRASLVAGHAFSVEPGIYVSGRFGARIEDIVVATEQGPRALNGVDHDLAIVEA